MDVLIVEDEGLIAKDLKARLIALGCVVSGIASSGEAAIEHVKRSPPDVVLMDHGLSGEMTGAEAAQRIREFGPTPIVFVTAHADVATIQQISALKPAGYIVKPYSQRELHAALVRTLGRSKPAADE